MTLCSAATLADLLQSQRQLHPRSAKALRSTEIVDIVRASLAVDRRFSSATTSPEAFRGQMLFNQTLFYRSATFHDRRPTTTIRLVQVSAPAAAITLHRPSLAPSAKILAMRPWKAFHSIACLLAHPTLNLVICDLPGRSCCCLTRHRCRDAAFRRQHYLPFLLVNSSTTFHVANLYLLAALSTSQLSPSMSCRMQ